MSTLDVDDSNPIIRFSPNRNYIYSKGWNFSIVNRGYINNYGFINNQDYKKEHQKNLMILIGDSYVEALMVSYKDTMQGRLASIVKDIGHVYSIGISGAQLSQYLVFAQYAQDEFHPKSMVFVIIGNDFDESLLKYKSAPGLHYFRGEGSEELQLMRINYKAGILKKLLRNFSLARYITHNINIDGIIRKLQKKENDRERYVGNTKENVELSRLYDSKLAIESFFSELSKIINHDRSKVLFVIDGMRPNIYVKADFQRAKGSYFDLMREYFMETAKKERYEYIDMQEIFITRYNLDGSRFEFPTDGHWNSLGHELAAQAIAASEVFKSTFGEERRIGPRLNQQLAP
jgi:hypothetical protein